MCTTSAQRAQRSARRSSFGPRTGNGTPALRSSPFQARTRTTRTPSSSVTLLRSPLVSTVTCTPAAVRYRASECTTFSMPPRCGG